MSSESEGAMTSELEPNTPVVVGVGQASELVEAPDFEALAPYALASRAASAALADARATAGDPASAIDVLAATRQFETSTPGAPAPLGRSTCFPRSVAQRIGADPAVAVIEVVGGQSPQHLVNEFAARIADGEYDVVLLTGAESTSTVRALAGTDTAPDWSEEAAGDAEDRGFGLKGLATRHGFLHGLVDAPSQYAFFENARRHRIRASRAEYTDAMAALFAPFTRVAAANPHAVAREELSAAELADVNGRNRMIAEPYPRLMVARDYVNQAAAVLLMSLAAARRLGVPEERWVFLPGHCDLREQGIFERRDLSSAPSAPQAVRHALEVAGIALDEVRWFDLYSCFPIAVSNVLDGLGLSADDPRGFTLTGGLPFFGGAGNNYSMHAIAEVVDRVRREPGSYGLVGANGGTLSKYSVGVYGSVAAPWCKDRSAELQAEIAIAEKVAFTERPEGWATVETYTIKHGGKGRSLIIIGRLERTAERFLARGIPEDESLLDHFDAVDHPIGQRVYVRSFGFGNRVTLDPERMAEYFPVAPPALRDDYEFVTVRRDGRVLEITINRPDERNALHPPANEELAEVFDAYFADSTLWAAIVTGAGTSFCAGNDLRYGASGKPVYVPASGFGGLTSRAGMHKPVIAAVNGYAMGGGFEIALACHLVVADEKAQFALSEVQVGLIAGAGGLVRLPRAIPSKVANELILTGCRIPVTEASALGLVNRLAPAGEALASARALAQEIVAASPTSVRLSLAVMEVARGVPDDIAAVDASGAEFIDELLFSEDAVEGVTAFAEKRPPVWKNR